MAMRFFLFFCFVAFGLFACLFVCLFVYNSFPPAGYQDMVCSMAYIS